MNKIVKKLSCKMQRAQVREVKIQPPNRSFVEFFMSLAFILNNGEKVYVSRQIFSEFWDKAQNQKNNVDITKVDNSRVLYHFSIQEQGKPLDAVFSVDLRASETKKIRLLTFKYRYINYKLTKNPLAKSFFIGRSNEKVQEK